VDRGRGELVRARRRRARLARVLVDVRAHAALPTHARPRAQRAPGWTGLALGQLLIGAAPERELSALELSDTFVYVRETCLVGFAGSAQHENGRLPTG